MSRLTDIPIRIEPSAGIQVPAIVGGLGGGVAAILTELVALLEELADKDATAMIDLRSLPMSPQDRIELQRALGEGEVLASVNAQGMSKVRETGVSGLWWVEHRDAQGDLIAEMIEVTRVPQILASASDEIIAGARALRAQITATAGAPIREAGHVPHQ
jgi:hydrogenase-1 operon protein HyaF